MNGFIDEKLYQKILANMPIPCVDIVLLTPDGVLLIKRDNEPAKGKWCLPGGRIFKGETIIKAARRKLLEEIDLKVSEKYLKVVGVGETIFKNGPFGVSGVHTVNSVVVLKLNKVSTVRLDKFHNDFKFTFNYNGLHKYVRWAIEESLNSIKY